MDHAKRSFYGATNAIFGKIGRIASEEVVLELIAKKCLPVLLYGLEIFTLNITEQRSVNFPFTRLLMKLFKTSSIDNINDIQNYFNLCQPSKMVERLKTNFMKRYNESENTLCRICVNLSRNN